MNQHRYSRFLSTAFFVGFLLACTLRFAEPDQDYDVSVTSIEVWIKAEHDGKEVPGLKQDDFEIYEDGHIVPLTCFEEISTTASFASPQTQSQVTVTAPQIPQPKQKFVLFLDLFDMTSAEYLYLKPKLIDFLNSLKGSNAELMVAALTGRGKLGIVQPFTSDFKKIQKILDQASGSANSARDQKVADYRRQIVSILDSIRDGTIPADVALRDAYGLAMRFAREEKSKTNFSLAALQTFSSYLSVKILNDHASILYLSGGINVDPGRLYYDIINQFVSKSGMDEDSTDFAIKFPSSIREPNFDVRHEITHAIGKLNRNNITVYTISSRGMVNPGVDFAEMGNNNVYDLRHDYQESLWQIAKETGGLSFENTNNFKLGFNNVLTDISHQYNLCYSPPAHPKKGEYHRIKVVCKKGGVSLRYRQGYID